jgi:hypothetical protein
MGHRVDPGIYRIGCPGPDAQVFASANYTLSFDALREALAGTECFILVLDTKGINVWCAAGKGTFGTDELVFRIRSSHLPDLVSHRTIIVPQLGAPGVSWQEVLSLTGFKVEYGPVLAADLPEYLEHHKATPAMRRVAFPLWDRVVLIPVELVQALPLIVLGVVVIGAVVNWMIATQLLTAILAGTVLFPILLPYLPTKDFSTKGLLLGFLGMLPFVLLYSPGDLYGNVLGWGSYAVASMLVFPPVTAYLALNFTGCTPFTSRTGVKCEIFSYIRVMVAMVVTGLLVAGLSWLTLPGGI